MRVPFVDGHFRKDGEIQVVVLFCPIEDLLIRSFLQIETVARKHQDLEASAAILSLQIHHVLKVLFGVVGFVSRVDNHD